MLVGKMLLVLNLVFLFGAKSQAQEEDEADIGGEEATPSEQSDGSSEGPPQGAESEKSAAPSPPTEVPEESATDSPPPSDTAGEASSQPDPSTPAEMDSSVSQPTSGEGVVAGSAPEGEAVSQEMPSAQGELTEVGSTGTSPPPEHGAEGVNPLVYVFGGFAGVIGLFSLYTFYRRKKTWDEISDAMRIDGGDAPLGSQPPSEFNTQDIAGISNTQVSKPISELND